MVAAEPPFYFIVTFWGQKYLDWFGRYSAASLLAEGNIDAVRDISGSRFLICTPTADWQALQRMPIYRRLRDAIELVHLDLPDLSESAIQHKYHRMSLGHKLLTETCHKAGAAAVYFAVDTVIPARSVLELRRLRREGAKVVWCTAIRFDMEGVTRDLERRSRLNEGQVLVISKREAVATGLANLHPESIAGEFDKPYFGELSPEHGRRHFPTCCFWRVKGEDGVVIYTHNWAPFLIDYRTLPFHDTSSFEAWAIDGDYIFRNFKELGPNCVHIVDDSDGLFLLGLTPHDEMVPPLKGSWWKRFPFVGELARSYVVNQAVFDSYLDPLRRQAYDVAVRWHSRDVVPAWASVEARAHRVMKRSARRHAVFDIITTLMGCYERVVRLISPLADRINNNTKAARAEVVRRCSTLTDNVIIVAKAMRGEREAWLQIKRGVAKAWPALHLFVLRMKTIRSAMHGDLDAQLRIKRKVAREIPAIHIFVLRMRIVSSAMRGDSDACERVKRQLRETYGRDF